MKQLLFNALLFAPELTVNLTVQGALNGTIRPLVKDGELICKTSFGTEFKFEKIPLLFQVRMKVALDSILAA